MEFLYLFFVFIISVIVIFVMGLSIKILSASQFNTIIVPVSYLLLAPFISLVGYYYIGISNGDLLRHLGYIFYWDEVIISAILHLVFFLLIVPGYLIMPKIKVTFRPNENKITRESIFTYFFYALIGVILIYLIEIYNIGIMGRPQADMPYMIPTFIFYGLQIGLPFLIISRVMLDIQSGSIYRAIIGCSIIIGISIGDAIVRGSKSPIIFNLIYIGAAISISYNISVYEFIKRFKLIFIIALISMIVSYGVLGVYRNNAGGNFDLMLAILTLDYSNLTKLIIYRFIGVGELASIISHTEHFLLDSVELDRVGAIRYFTDHVVNHIAINHSSSPGMLGSIFLRFGYLGLFIFPLTFGFFLWAIFVILNLFCKRKVFRDAALILFGIRLMLFVAEGDVKTAFIALMTILFMVVSTSIFSRIKFST